MINIFNKIINFNFTDLFRRADRPILDFEKIDTVFSFNPEKMETEEQLIDFLDVSLRKLANQIHLKIKIHAASRKTNSRWMDDFKDFKYAHLLVGYSDQIFKNKIGLHQVNQFPETSDTDESAFISLKLNEITLYIIEFEESKWQRNYTQRLYSTLLNAVQSFSNQLEKNKLNKEIISLSNLLVEKEKSLQIAEKAVKRKVYDLHNLVEASNEIYSILNFRQLINSALLTVIGQVGVQSAFVLMYDQSKRSYSQIFQKGLKAKEIQKLRFKVDSPLVKYFTRHNTPVFVEKLAKLKEFKSYVDKLQELGLFILAPIIYAERVQGIIATGEKLYSSEFTQTDFELFHVLVNIISISIENALHYEAVKNLSLTDEMTKLHNYRSFVARLREEINRAKRNKSKISLVILDIDHFKNYNDTLGHQAGDEALREVGKVLRQTVRDEDIVSRYGGEEFCIIFPGIEKIGIQNLGERIRKRMEKHKFYKEKVQPAGQLTISLGGATYPDDAIEMHDLIQKSDEALYRAKHLGRNQMQVFSSSDNSN